MKKILFLILFLISSVCNALEFQSSFNGIQENLCDNTCDKDTIFCYDWTIFNEEYSQGPYNLAGENQFNYSEEPDNAIWTKNNVTIIPNTVKSPINNNLTADTIYENDTAAGSIHYIEHSVINYVGVENVVTCSYIVKAINRNWVVITKSFGGNPTTYFDIQNGVIGTTNDGGFPNFLPEIRRLTDGWYQISITWEEAVGPNVNCDFYLSDVDGGGLYDGLGQDAIAFAGGQTYARSPRYFDTINNRKSIYLYTGEDENPSLDLYNISSAVTSNFDTMFHYEDNNNRIIRQFDGTFYRYSRDTYALQLFDSDHTITMIARLNDKTHTQTVWDYGTDNRNGARFDWNMSVPTVLYKDNSGIGLNVYFDLSPLGDDAYYLFQIVRNGNEIKTYLNGNYYATYDGTGYGDDPAGIGHFLVGTNVGLIKNYWNGSILYFRIDQKALTEIELLKDKEKLTDIQSIRNFNKVWTYTRNSISSFYEFIRDFANKTDTNNRYLKYFTKNYPRIHGDFGGLLIEQESYNYIFYSQEFDSWGMSGGITVDPDYDTFIDNLTTSDRLIGTNIADYIYLTIPDTFVPGDNLVFSVYAKNCDSYSDITITSIENGNTTTSNFNLTTDYQRYYIKIPIIVGGASSVRLRIAPTDGATFGNICINGAQLESARLYPSSFIPTAGDAIAREEDILKISWKDIFINNIGNSYKYNRLTLNFDSKCEFGSSSDLLTDRILIEISEDGQASTNRIIYYISNTGRVGSSLWDSLSNINTVTTNVDIVDYSQWHNYKITYDMADMTTYNIYIDDIARGTTFAPFGTTANVSLGNAYLRIGSNYNNDASADCRIKNLKVEVK